MKSRLLKPWLLCGFIQGSIKERLIFVTVPIIEDWRDGERILLNFTYIYTRHPSFRPAHRADRWQFKVCEAPTQWNNTVFRTFHVRLYIMKIFTRMLQSWALRNLSQPHYHAEIFQQNPNSEPIYHSACMIAGARTWDVEMRFQRGPHSLRESGIPFREWIVMVICVLGFCIGDFLDLYPRS